METKKRILVFNSGSGSGFQEVVENSKTGVLNAEIVGLITNNEKYGCIQRAEKLGIPVYLMKYPKDGKNAAPIYQEIMKHFNPDFIILSGWLKPVFASIFDPQTTINIHPGPLPKFGGKGMYGHYVHEAVIKAYKAGKITYTEVCIHFVTDEYDQGPVFFRYPVLIQQVCHYAFLPKNIHLD